MVLTFHQPGMNSCVCGHSAGKKMTALIEQQSGTNKKAAQDISRTAFHTFTCNSTTRN
jgi:hypothetical protein